MDIKKYRYWIFVFGGFLFIYFLLVSVHYYNLYFSANINTKKDRLLYIKTGSDFQAVMDSLKRNDLLLDTASFIKVSNSYGYPKKVKSGCYKLKRGMSNRTLVRLLMTATQTPVRVTFNNIRTPEQLAGKISKQLEIDSISFINYFRNIKISEAYGYVPETLISMFIPNTYEFYWNVDLKSFLDRMQKEHSKFWNESNYEKAKLLGLTREQVSTLASIVEEETNKRDEKARVAGVYINRLRKNMPLQADPTIKFALGDFTIKRLWTKHLEVNSPYNTYKHYGLPPGPICCPSISSLEAVLNYEVHQYYYFCAKDDFSGYHVFAKTLTEHNRNAMDYQRALDKEKIYK